MKYLFATVIVLALLGFAFKSDIRAAFNGSTDTTVIKEEGEKKNRKKNKEGDGAGVQRSDVRITQQWDLPDILKEVSGITYLDKDRIACIQDENGTIFIYNRTSRKIEKEIPFAGAGDYEGITLNGTTAYVVRSDGRLYEVADLNAAKPVVKEYSSFLNAEYNIEGLCFDGSANRLLLAAKDDKPGQPGYKSIYAFDLSSKTLGREPAYRIDLQHAMLGDGGGKKGFSPSAIGIHPVNRDIYVNDGPKSRLLILDRTGEPKKLVQLGSDFAQPEGITFSPQGDVFISNEGKKGSGNILQVKID